MRFATGTPNDTWLVPVVRALVGPRAAEEALAARDGWFWDAVIARGLVADDALLAAAAEHAGLPVADLSAPARRAIELVPERWARRYHVVPLAVDESHLRVATAVPFDLDCERTLAFATGRRVAMAIASPAAIARRLDELYRSDSVVREAAPTMELQHLTVETDAGAAEAEPDTTSTLRLVDQLLAEGIAAGASDIHVEPDEEGIAVRHRVDGVLRVVRRLPRSVAPALVSRVKILSGLDIADRLRPQDGRARVAVNGAAVDLRVSTLPASHGEKIVVRVLDRRATVLALDSMGFDAPERDRIERLLAAREGLILVTGPTGSGKTTTLYAALRRLRERGVNIVTVEDPIEYRLPGIVQVQVHERAGLTFAAALRSIMRQDPDVLLVGEIRDRETAEIAIQASLTGHLVLSTLHTNDAASAVTRLLDIGVDAARIATALKGVIAQRLVRRTCAVCAGVGCGSCAASGFRGRAAIAEVLVAGPEFERLVATGAPVERLSAAARAGGMRSLWESGLAHVARDATTMDELQRVVTAAAPGVDAPAASAYLTPTAPDAPSTQSSEPRVTEIRVATVDVFVLRRVNEEWRVLVAERAPGKRSPGTWEVVHGSIEPGETPEAAAVREVREETGLDASRLYNVRVNPFYLHRAALVTMAVVFAAVVESDAVTLGDEHVRHAWMTFDDARERLQWPSEHQSLAEIAWLLRSGDAGNAEDVLRVR